MVKDHAYFSHRQNPIVKENDNLIKLVFCLENCINFTWEMRESCVSGILICQGPVGHRGPLFHR